MAGRSIAPGDVEHLVGHEHGDGDTNSGQDEESDLIIIGVSLIFWREIFEVNSHMYHCQLLRICNSGE